MTGSFSSPPGGITASGVALWWQPQSDERVEEQLTASVREPLVVVDQDGQPRLYAQSKGQWSTEEQQGLPVRAVIPAVDPAQLGDPSFCRDYGLRYPYISGAMANGIGSVDIAVAMAEAGMLGFFGAAGVRPEGVAAAIDEFRRRAGQAPFGVNLIHTPHEPAWEEKVVDLLLQKGVRLVEASAYLRLTLPVVRYRVKGIHQDVMGNIVTPNRIVAKVSRVEVARQFMAPPPAKMLELLVKQGEITPKQAELAARVPVAQDITAEADSGGHTDNRPAVALLPTLCALRDKLQQEHGFEMPMRVGLAGGISTPASAAAAFAMGAAFILVGSVHQACVESGSSDLVRQMLAEASQADIAMAPAADMFEMGVNLQVLKRGTMFPMRAARLYELYRGYPSLEAIPQNERETIEKTIFRCSLEEVWEQTRLYFVQRDISQVQRAESDGKHKMALVFRWYLGKSSHWANAGVTERKIDFQIWCGPAMGAFNEWVAGTPLAQPKNRRVAPVAQNILYGAAVLARVNLARLHGVPVTSAMMRIQPLDAGQLKEFFVE